MRTHAIDCDLDEDCSCEPVEEHELGMDDMAAIKAAVRTARIWAENVDDFGGREIALHSTVAEWLTEVCEQRVTHDLNELIWAARIARCYLGLRGAA